MKIIKSLIKMGIFVLCVCVLSDTAMATVPYVEDFDDKNAGGFFGWQPTPTADKYVDMGGGDWELRVMYGSTREFNPPFGIRIGDGIYKVDMRFNSAGAPGGEYVICSIPAGSIPLGQGIYIQCVGTKGAVLGTEPAQILAVNSGWFQDVELVTTVASFRLLLKNNGSLIRVDCDKGLGYEDVFGGYINVLQTRSADDIPDSGTLGIWNANGSTTWPDLAEATQYDNLYYDVLPSQLMMMNNRLKQGSEIVPYSDFIAADFGTEPYTWAFVGTPPVGWNIEDYDTTTARVWHDDPVPGDVSFVVEVTDDNSNTVSDTITLTVIEMDVAVEPEVRLSWESEPGINYQLKWQDQLDTDFYNLGTIVGGSGQELEYYDRGQDTGDSPTNAIDRYFKMNVID